MTDGRWPAPPQGFVVRADARSALYVAAPLEAAAREAGLAALEGWEAALARGRAASGRAPTAVIDAPEGRRWRLKSLRRGGALASLWHDRYASADRPAATLRSTVEVARRGVPTAEAVALYVRRGPARLARAFMALVEIERAEDLARAVRRGSLDAPTLAAAMEAVRTMHDRGVVHPDLNLGNVLARPGGPAPEIFLLDFDRARVQDGPVSFPLRQAAIRRLERSCAKLTGEAGPLGPGSEDLWYTLYAAGDPALAARLARGRRAGRIRLAAHRLGWRGAPR